jgi:hypothetical protein
VGSALQSPIPSGDQRTRSAWTLTLREDEPIPTNQTTEI